MIYLIEEFGLLHHRIIAVKSDKDDAINFTKTHQCERGYQVWEFEINGGEGKRIYPDWN